MPLRSLIRTADPDNYFVIDEVTVMIIANIAIAE